MNWGLTDVEKITRYFEPDSISNKNNKYGRWINDNIDYTPCDILSVNVHLFKSITYTINKTQMLDDLCDFINKVKPQIVCLQESDSSAKIIMNKCGYKYYYQTENGYDNDNMLLCVFSKIRASDKQIIKSYADDRYRNSIMLTINHKKYMFIHGPIGESYFNSSQTVHFYEKFYKYYQYNTKMRKKYIKHMLSFKPDFIIGDFNIIPMDTHHIELFKNAGYITTDDEKISTSINDVKVDWTWHKPSIKGHSHVYSWWESDHRPIGFTFDKSPFSVKHGGEEHNINISMIVVIFLVIICLLLLLFYCFDNWPSVDIET